MAIFQPIKGTEEKIMRMGKKEGYVYFATDSGKIFLDVDDDRRISVGGSGASIYYSSCQQVNKNVIGQYLIPKTDLDDPNASPKEDDLIININGSFYKVKRIDDNMIYCILLAISGTGGGGGGTGSGGSGDGPSGNSIVWSKTEGISTGSIFIAGQPAYITLRANNTLGNSITYNIEIQTEYAGATTINTYQVGDRTYPNDTDVVFDLGSKMTLGTSLITLSASADDCGTAIRERTNIKTVVMRLDEDSDFNALKANMTTDSIKFRAIPVGDGITKKLKLYADGKLIETRERINTSGATVEIVIPPNTLNHGSHNLRAVLSNEADTVSCELNYEIIALEAGNDTPIIWVGQYEKSIVNHTALTIPYMVYNPSDTAHAEVYYYINGIRQPSSYEVAFSDTTWQNWRVMGYQVGTNVLRIETIAGTAEKEIEIAVEADDRNMDIVEGAYLVYDSEGRSNKENISSRTTWASTGELKTAVKFNDFNWYNNGWITDDDGKTCLRISNGASVSIPLNIMKGQTLSTGYTFEFAFKLRNVKTYGTLITTEVEEQSDGTAKVIKTTSIDDGVAISYYGGGVGLCLGTQEGFFQSRNTVVSGRYKEDDIVHVSFVIEKEQQGVTSTPLIYMYINGVNSGVATYVTEDDDFSCTATSLEINSNYCDVDLYKLRIYRGNLQARQVVQNYIADYNDVDMYDINNEIVEYKNNVPTINYKAVVEYNNKHKEAPLMPYAIIETTDINHELPYKKIETGDAWTVNATFINPYLDYLWESGQVDEDTYIHSCPSYTAEGVDLNVQGTSSQGYPRRNYKIKLKPASDKGNKTWKYLNGPKQGEVLKKWYMDSEVGSNKYTWKADYMESSRTHNSGFASFIGTLYSKHPLQDYIPNINTPENDLTSEQKNAISAAKEELKNYRTSVYGFPMMLFHKKGEDNYEFIGLYNYNLDKSCDDNFGFCDMKTIPSKVKDEAGEYLGMGDVAECWEFEHNQGGRCSFKTPEALYNDEGFITLPSDFEVRYHPDKDSIENAVFGNGDNTGEGIIDFSNASIAERNEYLIGKYSRINSVVEWVASTDTSSATNQALSDPVTYNGTEYTIDSAEYRRAKFRNEFEQHFDREYCEIYFIMTELLICYDSRGKNLMLATWGPKVEGGNDIWYPIFYDIDTQLGVNNSGVPYWDYYTEPTNNNVFSTPDSVLWNNLWSEFRTNIISRYNSLRGAKLTIDKLDGYYRFDPNVSHSYAMYGGRPIMAINVDEYYKYIDCAIGGGYVDTAGNSGQHTSTFFYCLQGTRELQRALFLRNRFIYLDSQWQAGDFSVTGAKQGLQLRYEANDISNTSDKYIYGEGMTEEAKQGWIDKGYEITDKYPANDFDTELTFDLVPYLKQYLTLYHDEIPTANKYSEDNVMTPMSLSEADVKAAQNSQRLQQIVYIPEPSYVSSLGDVSDKYLDQYYVQGGIRFKDIIVGNDRYGYMNAQLNDDSLQLDDNAVLSTGKENKNAKKVLEKVILSNLSSLTKSINVSGSEKLREFRALGTNISSVILAQGTQIETLHLPSTITALNLTEPTSLNIMIKQKPIELTGKKIIVYEEVEITENDFNANPNKYWYFAQRQTDSNGNVIDVGGYKLATSYNKGTTYFVLSEKDEFKYTNVKGLYVEDITDKTNFNLKDVTRLNRINIIGGNMGYNSYILLNNVVKIKQQMQKNEELNINKFSRTLAINMENVNWTPYRQVEYGEIPYHVVTLDVDSYVAGKYYIQDENGDFSLSNGTYSIANTYYEIPYTYVKRTEHYTFEPYAVPNANWKMDTLNGNVFEYDRIKDDKTALVDLSMLDLFIKQYEGSAKENYFIDTAIRADGDVSNRKPYISGNIFVHNENTEEIKESDIRNKYKQYYPELNIYVAKVTKSYSAKFVKLETNSEGIEVETEVDALKYEMGTQDYPECTSIIPTKLHYDFYGWSLDKNAEYGYGPIGTNYMKPWSELKLDKFSNTNDSYVFYAIFKIHTYTINFHQTQIQTSASSSLNIPYGRTIAIDSDMVPGPELGYIPWHWQSSAYWGQIDSLPLLESNEEAKVYRFVGWRLYGEEEYLSIEELSKLTPNDLYDSKNIPTNSQLNLFPAFEPVPVRDNVYPKLWKVQDSNNVIYSLPSGYTSYTNAITIPTKDVNGKDIYTLGGNLLSNSQKVGYVYLQDYNASKIKDLNSQCFDSLVNLKHIELPPLITTIPDGCFQFCSNLEVNETFFDNITEIDRNAFIECYSLKHVNLPVVKVLGVRAFKNCSGIETITIGKNATTPLDMIKDNYIINVGATTDDNKSFSNDDLNAIENQRNIVVKIYGSNVNITSSDSNERIKTLLSRLFVITNNNYPTIYCNDTQINAEEYFD